VLTNPITDGETIIFKTKYLRTNIGVTGPVNERSDCSVKALANYMHCSYEASHKQHSTYGRMYAKGTTHKTLRSTYGSVGLKCTSYGVGSVKGISVGSFVRKNSVGRFIVVITGHAFAVIDGKIMDEALVKSLARVQMSWCVR
jgi:hypothetical protein